MEAREFLSRHRIPFATHEIATRPFGPDETRALVARHRILWAKAKDQIRHWDLEGTGITEAEIQEVLIHRDGKLRVPVLSWGGLLIRGFTESLYQDLLVPEEAPRQGPGPRSPTGPPQTPPRHE